MRKSFAGLVLGVALLCAAACGRAPSSHEAQLYTVRAVLIGTSGVGIRACLLVVDTLPAQCGSGIPVKGVDVSSIPGLYKDGAIIQSPRVELVGTWDGRELTVTAAPKPTADADTLNRCPDPNGAAANPGVQDRLNADLNTLAKRGIIVLEDGLCPNGQLYVVVPVADDSTVSYLQRNYGPVFVVGWLKPIA